MSMQMSAVSTLRGGFFFPDLLPGDSFRDRMASLKRFGFDGVEIWGRWLKEDFDGVQQALKAEGVGVSTVCSGFRGNLLAGDREERLTCIQDFYDLIEMAGRLGATGMVFVPIFDRRPQIQDLAPFKSAAEVEMELFLDLMDKFSRRAMDVGTRLLLEPVNRYETHLINRIEQAVEVCRTIGSDALRITADFFHMNIEEVDIAQTIRKHGEYIGHVHLVDSNRCLPGQGHTDFQPAIQALQEVGYDNYLSLECFMKGDSETALPPCVDLMRKWIEVAEAR